MPPTAQPAVSRSARIGLMVPDALRLAGIQEILREEPGYQLSAIKTATPVEIHALDLLLIDEAVTTQLMPLLDTLGRARPQLRLLILGHDSSQAHAERIIGAGARGYLTHQATAADLRTAIDIVLDGSMWAPRRVLANLLEQARREAAGAVPGERVHFSKREVEVLHLLIDGCSNREIAAALNVDEGTVKAHLSRMMAKAGVRNRTALSMAAMREGWVQRQV